MKRWILLLLILNLCVVSAVFGQELPPPEPLMPEEYDPEEFPLWAHDLRRYEIVAIGSYPITFLATSLIYDFSVYAANDFSPAYSMGSQRSGRDIGIIAGSAACASLLIATVDLIINVNKRNRQESAEDEQ